MRKLFILFLIFLLPFPSYGDTSVSSPPVKADNTTIEKNGSGQLQIKDLGVSTAKIAATAVDDTKINFGAGANQVNTADVPELTNLYYTDARARASLSGTAPVSYTSATGVIALGTASVSTNYLKTAIGEVSTTAGTAMLALPGGEYGFYPQFKCASGSEIGDTHLGATGGTYLTYVTYIKTGVAVGAGPIYWQQRYVTASGQDHWLFLLIDKSTGSIISAYSAPDHPCYGNGGDPLKIQHPFPDYDSLKHEIVIADKATITQVKQEAQDTGKSILTLINEGYKPNMTKTEIYEPLHTGKFINQQPEMLQTLPSYIKVRKMVKKIL